jgi:hypothetical protein
MQNLSEPSRKIPKNYRNITGKIPSKKSNRMISFESKLERDFLYLFEFENFVIKILEQPITIEYFIDKRYTYTPDFYIETPPKYNNIIIEVKYYNELKKIFSTEKQKYKAMISYLKNKNLDFKFFTDRCTYIQSDEYKFNVNFLLNYEDLSIENYEIIYNLFIPQITVQQVLEQYNSDKFKQLSIISTIWAMVRKKILIVDMYEKLTPETQLLQLRPYDEYLLQLFLPSFSTPIIHK